jgi:hypothetical protein
MQLQRFSGLITDEQRAHVDWIAEICKDHARATVLIGYCMTTAIEHQDWTWWQVIEETHKRLQNVVKPA